MKRVVVVIPVHKPEPTQSELASLKQCYHILGSHPTRIVAPKGMDMSAYQKAVPGCQTVFIAPVWLSDIRQYNKLKISRYFYDLFKDYEYLLTYELDAWVFRDELLYWCDKGYDYIGAPWFEQTEQGYTTCFIGGANSGFSLRNVQKARQILKEVKNVLRLRKFWYRSGIQALFRFEKNKKIEKLFQLKFTENFSGLFGILHFHEDFFWGKYIPATFPKFIVAPVSECLKFSFEVNPSLLFEKHNHQLPFGCHAWKEYEPEFWKGFIKF